MTGEDNPGTGSSLFPSLTAKEIGSACFTMEGISKPISEKERCFQNVVGGGRRSGERGQGINRNEENF
jgi:hypothetical protein